MSFNQTNVACKRKMYRCGLAMQFYWQEMWRGGVNIKLRHVPSSGWLLDILKVEDFFCDRGARGAGQTGYSLESSFREVSLLSFNFKQVPITWRRKKVTFFQTGRCIYTFFFKGSMKFYAFIHKGLCGNPIKTKKIRSTTFFFFRFT